LISGYYLLKKQAFSSFWAWSFFWLFLWNIGEVFSYVILRGLSTHADVGNFNEALGLSPWWIFIIGTYFVIIGYHIAFNYILPKIYIHCEVNSNVLKVFIFIITILALILFTSIRPLSVNYNQFVHTVCYIAILSIPFLIYAYWPIKPSLR